MVFRVGDFVEDSFGVVYKVLKAGEFLFDLRTVNNLAVENQPIGGYSLYYRPDHESSAGIYLCGSINGRSDRDCTEWRSKAKELLRDFNCVDPMRRDCRGNESVAAHKIIKHDKIDIDMCKGLLVYFDRPSFGTAMEIFYAFQEGLKIVAVNASGMPVSPWVEVHSHAVVTDLAEGCEILGRLLCS